MKRLLSLSLICVLFLGVVFSIKPTYCFIDENLEFVYNGRIFEYHLEENIRFSSQFDLNFEFNKFNRFGDKLERKNLLQHMLNLGFDEEIALNYIFPNLNKTLNKIEKNVEIKSKNAQLKVDTNSEKVFKIQPEVNGVQLNRKLLIKNICKSFLNDKLMKFKVPTIILNPEITKNYFFEYTNLRSDFSTDISSSSADRKHNIKNAMKSLNLIQIAPNQIFSFNKIVGKRTIENGYRQAKIIVNNEFVEGLGGGVCQVSSTLYNSALLAGLEILEANKHSKQVSYVKYGFDAMVNFGSSDLKFRNNTNQKITLITNYNPYKIRIRIFGENLNGKFYRLTNEIVSIDEPINEIDYDFNLEHLDKVEYEDEFYYLQKPSRGMEVKSFRECYVDNKLVEKQLLRFDKFKKQNGIKIYGIKKRAENLHANFFK